MDQKTIDYIEELHRLSGDIKYELAPGIHTYHLCPHCKKRNTRSGRCAVCLTKKFIKETRKKG